MKTAMFKQVVKDLQRHKAQLDVALGKPPRKSSQTYIREYALAYAQSQILDNLYSERPF